MAASKRLEEFGAVFEPNEAVEPILAKRYRQLFLDWLTEIWAEAELREAGIAPRKRAIFAGPPGTGKTTLAHHLAARLGMRMLLVGPERINCTYVSASAEAVGRLFDRIAAQADPVVLFFDEFDSVAARRMASGHNPVGEQDHNLMINTLLARLDRHDGIVIAATNLDKRIDPAVWRRFNIHVDLPLPGKPERRRILRRYLAPFVLSNGELDALADAFEAASPALMRSFCENLKRAVVVGPLAGWDLAKDAMVSRVLEAMRPPHDDGLPRLWAHGTSDVAVRTLQWPLVKEARETAAGGAADRTETVVVFPGKGV